MKRSMLVLVLVLTACGSSDGSKIGSNGAETQAVVGTGNTSENTAQGSVGDTTPAATDCNTTATVTPTDSNTPAVVASPTPTPVPTPSATPVESNNTVAATDSNDTNPNHLNVDPVTGKLDYRYGVFSVVGQGGVAAGNYDGCFLLAGTNLSDPNSAGHYEIRTFAYDASKMTISNGTLTWKQSYVVDGPITGTETVTLNSDRTGTVRWEQPATDSHPACYTQLSNLVVYPIN